MSPSTQDKQAQLFSKYISQRKILIADTSSAARTGMARALTDLGAKSNFITMVANYELAEAEVKKSKPHVIICDYQLGGMSGLDLLQKQRNEWPESKECLFVLCTGNTSQSAAAQAAEEDVDAYILKPYTLEVLRNSLIRTALKKIYPSDYVKKIEEGKKLLDSGKPDEAIPIFAEAKTLDPKPSLACFYHGQAELLKELMEEAKGSYDGGLKYNKIHYKCLVGLYELIKSQKDYKEAYELVKRLSRYFPANPKRLTEVLRLAIMTKSYEDIERYYQVFTNFDQRNEELVRYICAALVVCGKFYLQQKSGSRAFELFQKAAVTAAGRTKILREIIMALISFDLATEAQGMLKRFPSDTHKGVDFLAMELLVFDKTAPPSAVVEKGRQILKEGVKDPLIYETIIRRASSIGLSEYAESLLREGAKEWPEQKDHLQKIYDQSNSAKSA